MSDPPYPGSRAELEADVARALAEDIGAGDVTAELLPPAAQARAQLICREQAVIAGGPWFEACFRQVDPTVQIHWLVCEGQLVTADTVLALVSGPVRALVTAERTALNFLQLLSATATCTARYVRALAGTGTRVLDTRKTLPGLRRAQKYAVRLGGGCNHRLGLFDAVMLKENHIAAAGGFAAAVAAARRTHATLPVIVEVETIAELGAALEAGPDRILLDDFQPEAMHAAVAMCGGRIPLEASGGVTLERLHEIAATGVEYVSVGALTKHVRAIDLSMRLLEAGGTGTAR
ncbi:MAG TPA: carboxylating nicotinate-nucleotide diphosphorylase [Xanthomonadaceae bacterium]|nr:carboxylating nicotinate-nucleotide diphosphorylase [Xanthomonadaceae bacterium]